MPDPHTTCWTMVEGAARGDADARRWFAAGYAPLVRNYLHARWARTPRVQDIEDAVQEVFLECYRDRGLLARADRDRGASFRAFLLGAVRNVARRLERRGPAEAHPVDLEATGDVASEEASLSVQFDRAWARKIMAEAAREQHAAARKAGHEAVKRVELLQLRFEEGLPIREIATRWEADATHLHRQYALARTEFRRALTAVLERYQEGPARDVQRECAFLLDLLG